MAEDEKTLEKLVLTRLMRLNAMVQGIVTGIIAGLGIFGATNWLILISEEGDVVGPHLSLLAQFFIGYRVSFVGSLIGFAYAFVSGFVISYGVTSMYNYIVGIKERKSLVIKKHHAG